jgi:hypothetical protein
MVTARRPDMMERFKRPVMKMTFSSGMAESRTRALAVLTRTPSRELIAFYARFLPLGYEVFVVVDDNTLRVEYPGIRFIQIDDDECRRNGFINFNPVVKKESRCSAWDKAVYYFCRIDNSHEHVWFIEDDVFVPFPETLLKLDEKYGKADIVSKDNNVNETGMLSGWFWWQFVPKGSLPPPWAHSMVCAVRLSRTLLDVLATFVQGNKTRLRLTNFIIELARFASRRKDYLGQKLLFIEYIFHTLALHNNCKIAVAKELAGIQWRNDWSVETMNAETLYHPFKNIAEQDNCRNVLLNRRTL